MTWKTQKQARSYFLAVCGRKSGSAVWRFCQITRSIRVQYLCFLKIDVNPTFLGKKTCLTISR